tara:strand:+ start:1383 stop:1553 length:171 start_codon:yes stop_codon:yes gene_type:complete
MIVRIRLEVSDEERKAIASHQGKKGKATREDVRDMHGLLWQHHMYDVLSEVYERQQ